MFLALKAFCSSSSSRWGGGHGEMNGKFLPDFSASSVHGLGVSGGDPGVCAAGLESWLYPCDRLVTCPVSLLLKWG